MQHSSTCRERTPRNPRLKIQENCARNKVIVVRLRDKQIRTAPERVRLLGRKIHPSGQTHRPPRRLGRLSRRDG